MMRGLTRSAFDYCIALTGLLAIWWYASGPLGTPQYLLPSPQSTAATLWQTFVGGGLSPHIWFTLRNILMGLVIGSLFGVAAAYLLYRQPQLSKFLDGPLVVFQTAPKIALAPLFVVWFGLGVTAKIVLIVTLVVFPVLMGALAGFRTMDSRLHDISLLLDLSPWARFFQIDLMAALPSIFVGIKIGAVQALVGAILAEWISGSKGLGYLMTFASATYKTPLLFGAVLLAVLLGIALHGLLSVLEKRTLYWMASDGH